MSEDDQLPQAVADVLGLPAPRAAVLLLACDGASSAASGDADGRELMPAPPEVRAALLALRVRLRGQGGGLSCDAAAKADMAARKAEARRLAAGAIE